MAGKPKDDPGLPEQWHPAAIPVDLGLGADEAPPPPPPDPPLRKEK
jgi:hypothetical protein